MGSSKTALVPTRWQPEVESVFMMKLRFMLPGVMLLVIFASACAPAPNLRNPKFLSDTSLITKDESCDAPCWRGITPGETTWKDAIVTLQDQPDLDDPQVQEIPNAAPAVGASWQQTSGEPCCQIVSEDGETVSSIFLQVAPNTTLKQLIEARGEPTYVLGTTGTDDQAIINLFYPEQSMIVFVFVAGATNGALSDTSEVIGAYYTTPDRIDLGIKLSSLYAWKGYQPFSAYAPDKENADFVITQSVTLTPTGEASGSESGQNAPAESATAEATASP